MNTVDIGAVMYELASKDISIATFFLLHNGLGNQAIATLAPGSRFDPTCTESLDILGNPKAEGPLPSARCLRPVAFG